MDVYFQNICRRKLPSSLYTGNLGLGPHEVGPRVGNSCQRRSGTRCSPAKDFCPASRFFLFFPSKPVGLDMDRLKANAMWTSSSIIHEHGHVGWMDGVGLLWVKCRAQFGLVWTVGDLFPLFPRQLLADYEVEILMPAEIVHFPYFHWICFLGGHDDVKEAHIFPIQNIRKNVQRVDHLVFKCGLARGALLNVCLLKKIWRVKSIKLLKSASSYY